MFLGHRRHRVISTRPRRQSVAPALMRGRPLHRLARGQQNGGRDAHRPLMFHQLLITASEIMRVLMNIDDRLVRLRLIGKRVSGQYATGQGGTRLGEKTAAVQGSIHLASVGHRSRLATAKWCGQ